VTHIAISLPLYLGKHSRETIIERLTQFVFSFDLGIKVEFIGFSVRLPSWEIAPTGGEESPARFVGPDRECARLASKGTVPVVRRFARHCAEALE